MAKQAPRCTRTYTHWGAWDVEIADRAIPKVDAFATPTILPD